MKRSLCMLAGVLLFLAPLKFLWGFRPVPEYRTGTFADIASAVAIGATLYGGMLAGIFAVWLLEPKLRTGMTGRAVFVSGLVGAMLAIVFAMGVWAIHQWLSTGRVFEQGSSLALLPVIPILGGALSVLMAGGAGLVAYALRPPTR